MKQLVFTFFILFAFSCQKPIAEGPQKEYFFPLKDFMDKEIERLEAQQAGVEKKVTIGNKTETKKIAFVNWERELQPFVTADINKSTFVDRYTTTRDTISNGHVIVTYKALSDDLNTQFLQVTTSGDKVIKIEAVNKTDNPVYVSQQSMIYEPEKGYAIEAQQDVRFSEEKQFKVEAQIVK